jgi:regulatory protein
LRTKFVGREGPQNVPVDLRLWHKNGVMTPFKGRRALPPLSHDDLQALALRYVGRYATTRAKLRAYLARKIRERGWDDRREPDLEAIANRFAELGYVDDSAYALSKSRSLTGRGYGKRRLQQKLHAAGVDDADSTRALDHADLEAIAAALRFAERRKIGPFAASAPLDRKAREKAVAAMVRAGHAPPLAWAIASLGPGTEIDLGDLAEHARLTDA